MHIGFAWELGGQGGHLARWRVVTDALRGRGWRVSSILRQFAEEATGVVPLPAPVARDPVWAGRRARSIADVLTKTVCRPGLTQRTLAWQRLLEELRVDVLVADYAPTALLAGRLMGLPRVTLGTGFSRCPREAWCSDLARLAGLNLPTDSHRAARGEVLLERLNQVPKMPTLGQLGDLFDGVPDLRCGFEALDPFAELWGGHDRPRWLGTLPTPAHPQPEWPTGGGARILFYAGRSDVTRAAVELLRAVGHRVLDLAADLQVNLRSAAAQADLIVCQGNYGVVSEALRAGKPIALVPVDVEKGLIAGRVVRLGAGRLLNAANPGSVVSGALGLLCDMSARAAAERFAAEQSAHAPLQTLHWVCDAIGNVPAAPNSPA